MVTWRPCGGSATESSSRSPAEADSGTATWTGWPKLVRARRRSPASAPSGTVRSMNSLGRRTLTRSVWPPLAPAGTVQCSRSWPSAPVTTDAGVALSSAPSSSPAEAAAQIAARAAAGEAWHGERGLVPGWTPECRCRFAEALRETPPPLRFSDDAAVDSAPDSFFSTADSPRGLTETSIATGGGSVLGADLSGSAPAAQATPEGVASADPLGGDAASWQAAGVCFSTARAVFTTGVKGGLSATGVHRFPSGFEEVVGAGEATRSVASPGEAPAA